MSTLRIEHATFRGEPKPAGRDNHAHVVPQDDVVYDRCVFDANGASEALKSSKRWGISVNGSVLRRGTEDCADHVRGGWIDYAGCTFQGKGRKLTIKGGVRTVLLINNRGLDLIVLGDYTKYDAKATYPDGREVKAGPFRLARPPVRNVTIATPSDEPRPWVICLHAERPFGDGRVVQIPRPIVALYFWLRATLWKETQPVPAEEFHIDPREIA
jgi:hypothetical protein